MSSTTKQPKVSMTHGTASQKAGKATYIDNMSRTSTPCRTIPPPNISHSTKRPTSERHQSYSQNGHSPCCMHVYQPQSQVCKPAESLALRKVQHPHNGNTSVNRFPLTKQDILSQYSGCFEGIGRSQGIRTSFTSNLTTSWQDMHQERFQSILKQHSRRKSTHW